MTMNGMVTSGNIYNRNRQQDPYKDRFHPDFTLHLRGLIFRIM